MTWEWNLDQALATTPRTDAFGDRVLAAVLRQKIGDELEADAVRREVARLSSLQEGQVAALGHLIPVLQELLMDWERP